MPHRSSTNGFSSSSSSSSHQAHTPQNTQFVPGHPSRNCARAVPAIRGVLPVDELTAEDASAQMENLEKDIYAPGTLQSRQTHRNTWEYLHRRWFGADVPVLPLTPNSIRAVAAQMKHSTYRSFRNYVDTMVSVHCEAHEWHRDLDITRKQCVTSALRGIGPPKQCQELKPEDAHSLILGDEPLHDDGPLCPKQWAIISSFHVVRGAEAACALASNLVIDSNA